MSQYLLYSGFAWINKNEKNKNEIANFFLNSIGGKSSDGYILEVGLEFLDELHELRNDYALATVKCEISQNMLSNYCKSVLIN